MRHTSTKVLLTFGLLATSAGINATAIAQSPIATLTSPDSRTWLKVSLTDGRATYSAGYKESDTDETTLVETSPLGLITNIGDLSRDFALSRIDTESVNDSYTLRNGKFSHIDYAANAATICLTTKAGNTLNIRFEVSNENVAFRYEIPQQGKTMCCVIESEATGFRFPEATTSFICPQSVPMIGFARTKPSYEESYKADAPLDVKSGYGQGYTFPCLFHAADKGWILVSETGTSGRYCGCHLSDYTEGGYTIAFPQAGENNGFGSTGAQMALPGETPWRTIVLGRTLKPMVETTVQHDVVRPLYEPSCDYLPGRSSWSWIVWQDRSMNYQDQQTFIDLAATMGWEYILIDALWDSQVGRDKMPDLFKYAQGKGVNIFLWYNSNGGWNDAPQDVKQRMCDPIARKQEMRWLRDNGVKGLKVDFFGGDKQETIKLYEAILSDANDYGLQIIFHGCTLPRGWERMYPNYCSSEAVLASENLVFGQGACDAAAFNACLHPFIRNAVGSMDFGGTFLQKRLNRDPHRGTIRRTTDVFELATAILYQSCVQNFALTPLNLTDQPAWQIDFMKTVPTTWDETRFIDGYPGRYVVLARRHGADWYVAAVSADKEPRTIRLELPMLADQTVTYYNDGKKGDTPTRTALKVNRKGLVTLTLTEGSGAILTTAQ